MEKAEDGSPRLWVLAQHAPYSRITRGSLDPFPSRQCSPAALSRGVAQTHGSRSQVRRAALRGGWAAVGGVRSTQSSRSPILDGQPRRVRGSKPPGYLQQHYQTLPHALDTV